MLKKVTVSIAVLLFCSGLFVSLRIGHVARYYRTAHAWWSLRANPSLVYTVSYSEDMYCGGKIRTGAFTRIRARRSDGSWVDSSVSKSGMPPSIRMVHLASGKRIVAYDSLHCTVTWGVRPAQGFDRLDPGANCLAYRTGARTRDEYLANEAVRGYRTVKAVQHFGPQRLTQWYAPDLGCVPLRQLWELRDQTTGAFHVQTAWEAISIETAEPSPVLFDVPADYDEVAPSELAVRSARMKASLGGEALSSSKEQTIRDQNADADAEYAQNHVPR